jgi:nitrite reductase/ring-hydroxylating ferredoxin subunit
MNSATRLCKLEELLDGNSRGFDPLNEGQDSVVVVRRGNQARVYRDRCPHQGNPMAPRKDEYLNAEKTEIVCWAHGARFAVDSGVCIFGPCIGESLRVLPHVIDDEGYVCLTP